MAKPPASSEQSHFTGEVPFPTAEIKFLDGLTVSLRPKFSMSHSVTGVHYVLECRSEDGQVAAIDITLGSRLRRVENEEYFQKYIELQPSSGMPLEAGGERNCFTFNGGSSPSFVPRDNNYRINQVVPGGGYKIEVEPFFLNCLRLFYEPPYKGQSEADL